MNVLIKKHLEAHKGLEQASIKNFAETGKISGSFFIALKEMIKEDRAEQLRLHGVGISFTDKEKQTLELMINIFIANKVKPKYLDSIEFEDYIKEIEVLKDKLM